MAKKDIIDILMEELELWEKEEAKKSYSHKPHLASLPHDRRTNDPELLQERIDAIDERMADNLKKMDDLRNKINDTIERRDRFQKAVDETQELYDKQKAHDAKSSEYFKQRKEDNKQIRKDLRDIFNELSTDSMLDTMPASDDGYDIEEEFNHYFGNNAIANIYAGVIPSGDAERILKLADQIDKQWVYYDTNYSDHADEYMGEVHDFTDALRDYANKNVATNDKGVKDLVKEQDEIDHSWFTIGGDKLQSDRLKLIDSNNLIIKECDDNIIKDTRAFNKLGTQQKDYADERMKCTDKQKVVSDGK